MLISFRLSVTSMYSIRLAEFRPIVLAVFGHDHDAECSCPKMARDDAIATYRGRMDQTPPALQRPDGPRRALRRRVLRRRDVDRHLLPADLSREDAEGEPTAGSSPRRSRPSSRGSGRACAAGPSWRREARPWTTASGSRS